jgi:hypothetical protein
VTAPFALLGSLFGGGEELSYADYAPGLAAVPAAAETKLQSLAKALTERPGLKLDIAGRADPAVDRAGLQQAKLAGLLRGLKRKDLADHGALVNAAEVTVGAEERPAWIARAYKDEIAHLPAPPAPPGPDGKPVPTTPAQMEQLLLDRQAVSEDDLRALGNQRAQAAKDWLDSKGGIGEERLALVGAKVGEAKEAGHGSGVEFALH